MPEIRYAKIMLPSGVSFILRITGETPLVVRGFEVNVEGDDVAPAGYDRRLRIVAREGIKKIVELRMNKKYATLEPASAAPAGPRSVSLSSDTKTLAEAMFPGSGLALFNAGVYEGTKIPIRRLTGHEVVTVVGTSAGARVSADETWIADRFGALGARQIKRLRSLVEGK